MAFILREYIQLLEALRNRGYQLGPVRQYFLHYEDPFVFLRHDVDRMPWRASAVAEAEHELGCSSTYYFRCSSRRLFPENQIKKILSLGHEIGFHYETVTRYRQKPEAVPEAFKAELNALRNLAEVDTVAAHGSPFSQASNIAYTRQIDLESMNIMGEPQVHFDFSKVLYITDTGGTFGSPHNRRDWSDGKNLTTLTPPGDLAKRLNPVDEPLILLSTHPERWPSGTPGLFQAKVMDYAVNIIKSLCQVRDSKQSV